MKKDNRSNSIAKRLDYESKNVSGGGIEPSDLTDDQKDVLKEIPNFPGVPKPEKEPNKFFDLVDKGSKFMTDPDNLQNIILPLTSAIESIASGGASPGTGSMQLAKQVGDTQKAQEERLQKKAEAKRAARARQMVRQLGREDITSEERNRLLRELYPKEVGLKEMDLEYKTLKDMLSFQSSKNLNNFRNFKDKRDTEISLYKDFRSDSRSRNYGESRRVFNNIKSTWNEDVKRSEPNRGAIDQSLITSFNKLLDPGSVVRESEYARTPHGMALISILEGFVGRIEKGGSGITDEYRDEIVEVAERLYNNALQDYKSYVSDFIDRSKSWGASPYNVVGKENMELIYGKDWLELIKLAIDGDEVAKKYLDEEGIVY